MRLLALDGRRVAALEQFETYRRILAEEFGLEPEEETRRLAAQIRTGAPLAAMTYALPTPPPELPP